MFSTKRSRGVGGTIAGALVGILVAVILAVVVVIPVTDIGSYRYACCGPNTVKSPLLYYLTVCNNKTTNNPFLHNI